ncbi:hypothetical protein CPB83DRAFT_911179 [Crepidotus variabilis]|uniref:Uncharacterized protein n=1 Tax=Crepidotus variabilis TaxID=179855 RepID=A0A9P6JJ63_9AGAR|nr:hypothetical protein CPB83DRAFT_911179 [Crepidotus variabilis]
MVLSQQWIILGFLGLLAEAKLGQGKLVEAEEILVKATGEGKKRGIPLSSAFLHSWDQLIRLYLDQERWEEAADALEELMQLKEKMASKSSIPRGFSTRCAIPELHKTSISPLNKEKVWKAASQLLSLVPKMQGFVEYKEGKERVLGLLLSLFDNRHQLAGVYLRQRRYTEARPLLEMVVQGALHRGNPTLSNCWRDIAHYAVVCIDSEEWKDAEWLQEMVVGEQETRVSGGVPKHDGAELYQRLQQLSHIYRKNGRWLKMHEVNVRLIRYHTRPSLVKIRET